MVPHGQWLFDKQAASALDTYSLHSICFPLLSRRSTSDTCLQQYQLREYLLGGILSLLQRAYDRSNSCQSLGPVSRWRSRLLDSGLSRRSVRFTEDAGIQRAPKLEARLAPFSWDREMKSLSISSVTYAHRRSSSKSLELCCSPESYKFLEHSNHLRYVQCSS